MHPLAAFLNPAWQALPSYVAGLSEEAVRQRLGLAHIVKLGSNENPLGPGAAAIAAMQRVATAGGRYPDATALELALARALDVDPARLTLTNGSSEALDLVARAFLDPTREGVCAVPSFILYPIVVRATGARLVQVPARADWTVDLAALGDRVGPATRLVIIGNPNNPTGRWHDEGELVHLLERLPPPVAVVLDEAYREYVAEPGYPDGVRLQQRFPNLIVTRTFSKVHGLAGLRVGYAVAHPTVTAALRRARPPFNVNALALAAAEAALGDRRHVEDSVALTVAQRRWLTDELGARGLAVVPSVANFVTVGVGANAGQIAAALVERGVIVRPIGDMPGHLRVTVGTEPDNRALLAALDGVLAGARGDHLQSGPSS